jgi:hypothetical protein
MDDVFLLQIMQVDKGNPPTITIVQAEDDDYLFEPYFLDLECWEDILKELKEKVKDEPPTVHPEAVLECCMCGSSVLDEEYIGAATPGEIMLSSRRPDDRSTTVFQANGQPDIYCLHCFALIDSEELEMWEGVSQNGECLTCLNVRCWRNETCSCSCHTEET